MKKIIKNLIPIWFLKLYKKIKIFKFINKSNKDIFTTIYNTNHWKSSKSISGTGSEISQTRTLIENLNKLIKDKNISSILDIPCGDFGWMKEVDLSNIKYTGADIVEKIIDINKEKYLKDNLNFKVLDLTNDQLPKNDLIIIRDCLVHLSYKDIDKALKNIKLSECKYLLLTTFTNNNTNYDIITGDWRKLNFQKEPFNFSNPILIINENCTEENAIFKDKSMALWEIDKI